MREYGKVFCSFWSSATIAELSDDGKMLALYLMTCSHSTIAGVFRLPGGYVAEDLRWGLERVAQGFAELFAKGFANRCETTKWVWVVKHLEWNKPENPNQWKAVAKVAGQIPDQCAWKAAFMRVCGPSIGLQPEPSGNPSPTVQQPFPNQEQKQKQKQKQDGGRPVPADEDPPPAAGAAATTSRGSPLAKPRPVAAGSATGPEMPLRAQTERWMAEQDKRAQAAASPEAALAREQAMAHLARSPVFSRARSRAAGASSPQDPPAGAME